MFAVKKLQVWLTPRLFTSSLILCNLLGPSSPEYLNYPSILRHLVAKSQHLVISINIINTSSWFNSIEFAAWFMQFPNLFWRFGKIRSPTTCFYPFSIQKTFDSNHLLDQFIHLKCLRWSFSLSGHQLFDFDRIFVGRQWVGTRFGGFASPAGAWIGDRGSRWWGEEMIHG